MQPTWQALNFDKPIFNFKEDSNCRSMVPKDVTTIVWETKDRKAANAKTILDTIKHEGHWQEVLRLASEPGSFLGNFPDPCSNLHVHHCMIVSWNTVTDATLLQEKPAWLMVFLWSMILSAFPALILTRTWQIFTVAVTQSLSDSNLSPKV